MPAPRAIGIDLGTTFSAIAFVDDDGRAQVIPNREGERITPSVVLLDGTTAIVGAMARESASDSPLDTVQFVKRKMGDPSWEHCHSDGSRLRAEAISAMILRRLRDDAERFLGCPVQDAVISVPAYFNDAQRKSTMDAGKIAGLNVLGVINEPTAAALAYGIDHADDEQTVLVYDLGGGTFDVTIMRVASREISVLATGGDKNLGGFDWDNALIELLAERYRAETGEALDDDPAAEHDLRTRAEVAKRILSQRDRARVVLGSGGRSRTMVVERSQFEEATRALLRRTRSILDFVREDAGLRWEEIDRVLLVGGSTRMPAVAEMIREVTGLSPSTDVHPDEVVALGAALRAALLLSRSAGTALVKPPPVPVVAVSDVTSHSLGVVALDVPTGRTYNSIILPRNTPVPASGSSLYETVVNRQTEIEVEVTQGEDSDLAYVQIVGTGKMKLPEYPRGAPIEVGLSYDDDGIIHVTVTDRTANEALGEMYIDRRSNMTEREVARLRERVIEGVVE